MEVFRGIYILDGKEEHVIYYCVDTFFCDFVKFCWCQLNFSAGHTNIRSWIKKKLKNVGELLDRLYFLFNSRTAMEIFRNRYIMDWK